MPLCSSCSVDHPETDFYHYTLASTGKRIRDKRCKACRKILTREVNRKRYAIVRQRELDRIERNRIELANDPAYQPVVFPLAVHDPVKPRTPARPKRVDSNN
jgi:hypothetical protein